MYAELWHCRCDACRRDRADEAREAAYMTLRDDDSEVIDACACADWPALDKMLPTAFRTGEWAAFTAELSRQIEARLQERVAD